MDTLFGKVTVYRAEWEGVGQIFKLDPDKTDQGWPSLVVIRKRDQHGDCLLAFSLESPRSAVRILKEAYRDWKSGRTIFNLDQMYEVAKES